MMQYFDQIFTLRLLFALGIAGLIICPVPALITPDNTSFSVTVTGTTHNSSIIRITADRQCVPVIRFANLSWLIKSGAYDHEVTGIRSGFSQVFSLTGLEPETRYQYQVNGCGMEERERSFTTFPESGGCSFVVYGDSREQAPLYTQTERHKIVTDRIADEEGIFFVVNSGDLVADSENSAEWSRFFDATNTLRAKTTYVAVPGNHDQDRILFRNFFGIDRPYSFDCGEARVLLLDSTDSALSNMTEQAVLVSEVFGSVTGAKIVVLHHPPYSSDAKHYGGWENLQKTLVPAFQKNGVHMVFSSHVHAFEQVEREDITYITEARGGAPAYPLNEQRIPGSVRSYENTLGYSRITVNPRTHEILTEVVRVADVSPDLRSVTRVYPDRIVDARIRISYKNSFSLFFENAEILCKGGIFSRTVRINTDGGSCKILTGLA
jgi:hypothetical protein